MEGAVLESVIKKVRAYVESLGASPRNDAAKRCFVRITDPAYKFVDNRPKKGSNLTTKQLLALAFLAIHDEKGGNRLCGLEDARAQFVDGLYEMQRGGNLLAGGHDDGGGDLSICDSGTFNKLIEKLQGVDRDCWIEYMTLATAGAKLPVVVREEAERYLNTQAEHYLAQPRTAEELQAFTDLMSAVKKDGIPEIWGKIKERVAERIYDEFERLFKDDRVGFIDIINSGEYTAPPGLSEFVTGLQARVARAAESPSLPRPGCK